jgi:hypothetical protein
LVEALRYKAEGRGFDSGWCHWNFFNDIILPAALTEMSIGIFPGRIKAAGA